jgi:hypothetical protein
MRSRLAILTLTIYFAFAVTACSKKPESSSNNKDIVLPAESALTFKLEQPLEVK